MNKPDKDAILELMLDFVDTNWAVDRLEPRRPVRFLLSTMLKEKVVVVPSHEDRGGYWLERLRYAESDPVCFVRERIRWCATYDMARTLANYHQRLLAISRRDFNPESPPNLN